MIFRPARLEEADSILDEGYKVWNKGRTHEKYFEDNRKEDAYGTRYVIEEAGVIVSSLIMLRLKPIGNREVYGIGSVLTPSNYMHRGYASALVTACTEQLADREEYLFLYSEISPVFYEKFGFKVLPPALQKCKAPCMVLCGEEAWDELIELSVNQIPDYF